MRAEIISIGTELLLGEIVDTNAAWLAQQLAAAGVDVYFRTTVGDNVGRIADVIRLALGRADIVISSGGLGPTVDDMTRQAIAEATNRELVMDEGLLEQIRTRFQRWGNPMSANNVRQAYIPRGAIPFPNPVGTAPIFRVDEDGKSILALPGVPREMKYLAETVMLPWLRTLTGGQEIILSKTLRTCAVGESMVDSKLTDLEISPNPTVGLAAHAGQTDVRITAKARTRAEAEKMIQEMEAQVRARLGDWIYGEGAESVAEVAARLLAARGWTLALVETNTRGVIAERLAQTPGAQVVVHAEVLEAPQVSEAGVLSQAARLRAGTGADVALAIAGTAEAREDMYADQTGHTWIAVVSPERTVTREHTIGGTGEMATNWISIRALDLVRRVTFMEQR